MSAYRHDSVLLNEAMAGLNINPAGIYLDGTFGYGGHSAAILAQLGDGGRLIALDRDQETVMSRETQHPSQTWQDERFSYEYSNFSRLKQVCDRQGCLGRVDGILLDLGLSSMQLDNPDRGFSFNRDGPLDMRMDRQTGLGASEWLNQVNEDDLIYVLRTYGEQPAAKRIARAILAAHARQAITTTGQLSDVVAAIAPRMPRGKHPATRVFQAIRIAVNSELDDLKQFLSQCLDVLAVGGRLCVISFHSLEDRLVKHFSVQYSGVRADLPPGFPVREDQSQRRIKKIGKLVRPSDAEVATNPRARSARMRIMEKIA